MVRYKVITMPDAEEDIRQQTDYIAFQSKSPKAAYDMVRGFGKTIGSLEIFPQRYKLDEDMELAKLGIRKVYYKNYKIYFLIDEPNQIIYILRVVHMLADSKTKILKFLDK